MSPIGKVIVRRGVIDASVRSRLRPCGRHLHQLHMLLCLCEAALGLVPAAFLERGGSYSSATLATRNYGFARCHTIPRPSPSLSPAALSIAK